MKIQQDIMERTQNSGNCAFVVPRCSTAEPRASQQVVRHVLTACDPRVAEREVEVAVRLFNAGAITLRVNGPADPRIHPVTRECQRLAVTLRLEGLDRDTDADRLVFGDRDLCPNCTDPRQIEPGRDVSDTVRRLSNHLAPRIHDH